MSRCIYGKCNGSGWISKQVWAKPAAMAGYWAWATKRCQCHPPRDAPEPKVVTPKPSYYEKGE